MDRSAQWLRRGLFGYRRRDVLAALESMRGQLDHMAVSLDRAWSEKQAAVEELGAIRAEYNARLAEEKARAERLEAEARAQAARVVADAEEQAARLRREAGRRIGDEATRLDELLRVREQLLGELRGIVAAYGDVLERAEQGRIAVVAPARDSAPTPLPQVAPIGLAGLFGKRVELDAGPFNAFSELAAFERSLARLPKVEDVYIRTFGEERAEIELTLTEETPLLHDLTAQLPYKIDVTASDDNRLTVDLAAAV